MGFAEHSSQTNSPASGTALIWVLLVLPVMLAMCALAVDFGRVQLAKAELQTAVHAAARAAARGNLDGSAITRAINAASENTVDGTSLVLQSSDVQLGRWDSSTQSFTQAILVTGAWKMADGSKINAVRVNGVKNKARNTAVPTSFAGLVGLSSMDLESEVIATGGPPTVQPVALHRFNETSGTRCIDTSGISTPQDAYVADLSKVKRVAGEIMKFEQSTKIATTGAATNVIDNLMASNQFTVFGRIDPKSRTQTDATILSVASDSTSRNLTIRQQASKLELLLRTKDDNGNTVNTTLQSASFMTSNSQDSYDFCATYDGKTLKLYTKVNANGFAGSGTMVSTNLPGNLSNWNRSYRLVYGNDDSNDRPYLGDFWHTGIYDTAMDSSQISELFGNPQNINFFPNASSAPGSGGGVVTVK